MLDTFHKNFLPDRSERENGARTMNIQLIKPNPINKIVVVGHPLSAYQEVETLLNTCGMNPAQPSRRDGFLPTEISTTLCKAHRIPPVHALHAGAEIEQLDAGPIWHGMALDLLLGNIEQEFWGWADPQAVYLLDYWKALDPQLAFVLVYDTPEQLVAQAFDEQTPLSPEALRQATHNWSAYNAALLHFYHRNPERCLLVHAQQVRASASAYLQQMRTRIGAPVQADRPQANTDNAIDLAPRPAAAPPQDALKAYIAHALIQQQPDTLQLYEELQSVANLPLTERATAPYTPLDAWLSMAALQAHHTEQATQAQAHTQAQEAQIQALGQGLNNAEALAGQRQQHIERLEQTQASQFKEAAATPPAANPELQQENELLLLQLHQVQEELERYYLENQRLKAKPTTPAKPAQAPAPYGAAERVKQQLSYQLGSKMIERSRSLGGWLGMPFALMGVARQYKRELPKRKAAKQVPIEKYRDAYEAERVKQHLSYRLGTVLIQHGKNPLRWPALPFALQKARKAWLSQQAR